MMDDYEKAKFDQMLAGARDTMPRLWYTIYRGSIEAGFTSQQAFAIVTTYILSHNPHGIRPDGAPGPSDDGNGD